MIQDRRQFVRNLDKETPVDQAIVDSISRPSPPKAVIVAEFVESREILDHLARPRVDFAQGYAVGRPPVRHGARPTAQRASSPGAGLSFEASAWCPVRAPGVRPVHFLNARMEGRGLGKAELLGDVLDR